LNLVKRTDMHIEFIVEEPSAEEALNNIVPRIVGTGITFRIHAHQGKTDLLGKLSNRLKGYRNWLPNDWRIVVLIDVDDDNCMSLKQRLEEMAFSIGFNTKTKAVRRGGLQVLNRLAIEELEAWFFGDVRALRTAYPRIPATLSSKAKYRNPDAIAGGTWEALELVLQRAGYFPCGIAKISTAREISKHMVPTRNSSHSFQIFSQGLLDLINDPQAKC
jgi:hypothetical protein